MKHITNGLWAILLLWFTGSAFAQSDADALYQKGLSLYSDGKYEAAMDSWMGAIKQYRANYNTQKVADCYNRIGLVYQRVNQFAEAKGAFLSAAKNYDKVGDKLGAAAALTNLGISEFRLKQEINKGQQLSLDELQEVLGFYEKAVGYYKEAGDRVSEADVYVNISNLYVENGQADKAIEYLVFAVTIQLEENYKGGLIYGFANIGRIYYGIGDEKNALKNYTRSVKYAREVGNREVLWQTYYYIGLINNGLGNKEEAVKALKESVSYIESLKGNFKKKEFFEGFLKNKLPVYNLLVQLLNETGKTIEALQYLERSKAKLSNDVFASDKIQVEEKEAQEKVDKVQKLQDEKEELEQQLAIEKEKPPLKQDKEKLDKLSQQLAATEGDFNSLMIDLEVKYPNIYSVLKVDPLQVADLQSQLDDNVVVLEYFPAEDALYIFLITKDKVEAKTVPISKTVLDSTVNKFRYLISEVPSLQKRKRFDTKILDWKESDNLFYKRHLKPLRQSMIDLYDYLILPVWDEVKKDQYEVITVIPSGSLYYVPFQSLATETVDGDLNFLIEKKAVSYLSAATLMDIVSKKKQTKISDILIFGNPDGSLPGALDEAQAIQTSYKDAVLYTLADATEDRAKDFSADFQVLHLATHGFLANDRPQDSFILMTANESKGEDGKLKLTEILKLPLKKKNELVVLSACNTAMGQNPTGVELISLSRAFAVAGSPTIVATLWPVSDEATKRLMIDFYKGLKGGLSKVEAMRSAQIGLIRGGDSNFHPFFWSPFIMIGNPK